MISSTSASKLILTVTAFLTLQGCGRAAMEWRQPATDSSGLQFSLASPTPDPAVSPDPNASPIPIPTVTVTASPGPIPTVTIVPSPVPEPTVTVTILPSPSPVPYASPIPVPTVTVTASPGPIPTVTVTASPLPEPTVTVTVSPAPSTLASPSPDASASPVASSSPVASPSPMASPTPVTSPSPVASPSPNPTPTICNPFGGGNSATNEGLKSELYYLEPGQTHGKGVDYIMENGTKSNAQIFLSQLFIPTRDWTDGFQDENGNSLVNSIGQQLNEYFALDIRTEVRLSANQPEGYYELATISDDGSQLISYEKSAQGELMISNDGDHPTRMGCSMNAIYMRPGQTVPIRVKWYQGPRTEIALVLMWRKVSGTAASLYDPLCGVVGGTDFFPENGSISDYQIQLLSRGWSVLSTHNFRMPGSQVNQCSDGTLAPAGQFTPAINPGPMPMPTPTIYPMLSVQSDDILDGWFDDNAIDGDPTSVYSSTGFNSEINDRGSNFAAWMDSSLGALPVSTILISARMSHGMALGFPKSYNVYLTASDNSAWELVGNYQNQPDSKGLVAIQLPRVYQTYGVNIVPTRLGMDDTNGYYFQLAEVALGKDATTLPTSQSAMILPMTHVESNDHIPGWPASNAIDGNLSSVYSSQIFPSGMNDRNTYLAAWLDPSLGSQMVSTVILKPRITNGQVLAFPSSYDLYLTTADNSTWIPVGTYSNQPDSTGMVSVDLNQIYFTYGVMIVPRGLGLDDYNNPYFQLAEISLGGP